MYLARQNTRGFRRQKLCVLLDVSTVCVEGTMRGVNELHGMRFRR